MLAAEDIQRQIAVAVVIAVEEASFLLAVQRQIGGVYIQNDLFRCVCLGLDKDSDEQLVDSLLPERDLLVSILLALAKFQPVQRALTRQRPIELLASSQYAEQRICSQLLVIVQVFIAQSQPVHSL